MCEASCKVGSMYVSFCLILYYVVIFFGYGGCNHTTKVPSYIRNSHIEQWIMGWKSKYAFKDSKKPIILHSPFNKIGFNIYTLPLIDVP